MSDDGDVVVINTLNGIFNCDYVILVLPVYCIDHSCQGGGLSASSRTGDENKPALQFGKFPQDNRDAKLLKRSYAVGDKTEDSTDTVLVLKIVDPETRVGAFGVVYEIQVAGIIETVFLGAGKKREQQVLGGREQHARIGNHGIRGLIPGQAAPDSHDPVVLAARVQASGRLQVPTRDEDLRRNGDAGLPSLESVHRVLDGRTRFFKSHCLACLPGL